MYKLRWNWWAPSCACLTGWRGYGSVLETHISNVFFVSLFKRGSIDWMITAWQQHTLRKWSTWRSVANSGVKSSWHSLDWGRGDEENPHSLSWSHPGRCFHSSQRGPIDFLFLTHQVDLKVDLFCSVDIFLNIPSNTLLGNQCHNPRIHKG
jgi:hypothetical protein